MKNINIKVRGASLLKPTILIDGKQVRIKKNNYGSYETEYSTEKDSMEITIYRYLEVHGRLWYLMTLIYFFISLFGLLDPVREKKCVVIDARFVVDIKDVNLCTINLAVQNPKTTGDAVTVETDLPYETLSNVFFVDEKAKKKIKLMRILKAVLAVGIAIALVFILR